MFVGLTNILPVRGFPEEGSGLNSNKPFTKLGVLPVPTERKLEVSKLNNKFLAELLPLT
jgi:hypothetical protein